MSETVIFICLLAIAVTFAQFADYDYYYDSDEILEDNNDPSRETGAELLMSVCMDNTGKLYTHYGDQCNARVAVGRFRDDINRTGWAHLEVETNKTFQAEVQAYSAGVIEGILSKRSIYNHLKNTVEGMCDGHGDYCTKLHGYLLENMDWMRSQLLRNWDDPYWKQVNITLAQLTGVTDGYSGNKRLLPKISFDITPIVLVQMDGELQDLNVVFNKSGIKSTMMKDRSILSANEKCSSFVKVSPGNRDIFFGHTTMCGYQEMTRVLKLFKFGFDKEKIPGHTMAFSGYPGVLTSSDDFVLLSSGLATTETTLTVYNEAAYGDRVRGRGSVHEWIRSGIANGLARSGRQWTRLFGRFNSGTYNNQWSILDYKLFRPGRPLVSHNLIWLLEQMPGQIKARDVTPWLKKHSYWASYNMPYFKILKTLGGYDWMAGKYGDWYRWGRSPRARIFHRDMHKVVDIPSLLALMRYNNFKKDPLSRCQCRPPYTGEASISARADLNPINGSYPFRGMGHGNHGGIDAKGTNYKLFKKLQFHAWAGPTYDYVPVFNWKTTDIRAKHYGMPDEWKFGPVQTVWTTAVSVDL